MEENRISFSKKIKEELASKIEDSDLKNLAILSSFLKINGIYKIQNNITRLILKISNAKIASYILELLKKYFNFKNNLFFNKSTKLNKISFYIIDIVENVDEILDKLKIDIFNDEINPYFYTNKDLIYGYLKGAFLASGSVNSPKKSNYHLEIKTTSSNMALSLLKMVNSIKDIEFNFRISKRRNDYIIYIKKSDLISSFLIMIGAIEGCLNFEDIRVERDYSNNENRLYNLDVANYSKVLKSSKNQLEDINIIEKNIGIKNLQNDKLIELCNQRLNNKEASLDELAKKMSENLKVNVSRSNVYHLFKKIKTIADKYRSEGI